MGENCPGWMSDDVRPRKCNLEAVYALDFRANMAYKLNRGSQLRVAWHAVRHICEADAHGVEIGVDTTFAHGGNRGMAVAEIAAIVARAVRPRRVSYVHELRDRAVMRDNKVISDLTFDVHNRVNRTVETAARGVQHDKIGRMALPPDAPVRTGSLCNFHVRSFLVAALSCSRNVGFRPFGREKTSRRLGRCVIGFIYFSVHVRDPAISKTFE